MKVLLLERSDLVSSRIATLLANAECVDLVETAIAIEEAVRMMKCLQSEVVVMEAVLPDECGLQTLTRLKGASAASRLVVMSAESSELFRRRWLEAGADHLLDISTQADELLKTICASTPGNACGAAT